MSTDGARTWVPVLLSASAIILPHDHVSNAFTLSCVVLVVSPHLQQWEQKHGESSSCITHGYSLYSYTNNIRTFSSHPSRRNWNVLPIIIRDCRYAMSVSFTHRNMTGTLWAFLSRTETRLVRYERLSHIHNLDRYAMSVSFTYRIMTGTLWAFLSRTDSWLVRSERFSHYILMTSRSERFVHIQNHAWYDMSVSFTHRTMNGTPWAFLSHTDSWLVCNGRFFYIQIHDWNAMSVSLTYRIMTGTIWAFLSRTETWLVRYGRFFHIHDHDWYDFSFFSHIQTHDVYDLSVFLTDSHDLHDLNVSLIIIQTHDLYDHNISLIIIQTHDLYDPSVSLNIPTDDLYDLSVSLNIQTHDLYDPSVSLNIPTHDLYDLSVSLNIPTHDLYDLSVSVVYQLITDTYWAIPSQTDSWLVRSERFTNPWLVRFERFPHIQTHDLYDLSVSLT